MGYTIDEREEQIPAENRYLYIDSTFTFEFPKSVEELKRDRYPKVSDEKFESIKQEFTSFVREHDNKNLLSVGMYRSYANINLPKTYDIIFDIRNKKRFWEQKTIVKYAYNYRDVFHADLWQGHSSLLIIEVIGEKPIIFDELQVNLKGDNKGLVGLCSKYDWEIIKNIKYPYQKDED